MSVLADTYEHDFDEKVGPDLMFEGICQDVKSEAENVLYEYIGAIKTSRAAEQIADALELRFRKFNINLPPHKQITVFAELYSPELISVRIMVPNPYEWDRSMIIHLTL